MLYLAFIFHMHQPYYKNLLTRQTDMPWVRLHGTKDYLDMVEMLEKYPKVSQTFNLVPSLLEQIEDYTERGVKDKYLELSNLPAEKLSPADKEFILAKFFSINPERCIANHPRYYELYFKKLANKEFDTQDYLDLQVWFNLVWIDPYFRKNIPELKKVVGKARFFSEEDKHIVLDKQLTILKGIIPAYKKFMASQQVEVILSPYYHPILPLLYNTRSAKDANFKTPLPNIQFRHPEDARAQINEAVKFYEAKFGTPPQGMWPSEQAVSQDILPLIIQSGINWIVADEAILFRSLKLKKRATGLLYQPHFLKTKEGRSLNIVFRDRNLSDLIGFVYHRQKAQSAVDDLMKHLENIAASFKNQDILVTIALDGENAWEFYANDGHDFLELLYRRLSESDFLKTTTISQYLKTHPAKQQINHLAAGSWIYGEFNKWIGNPHKNKAWEYLEKARQELEVIGRQKTEINLDLAWKQMHILEGSDWFWWYGDVPSGEFDMLFRMHLSNFYKIIGKDIPGYLNHSL